MAIADKELHIAKNFIHSYLLKKDPFIPLAKGRMNRGATLFIPLCLAESLIIKSSKVQFQLTMVLVFTSHKLSEIQ
ncbi:hypothetical protein E4U82_06505 [Lentibacillus salicampi]|uniref:Uncharacterized protein n=1 Tax=Lentibacillus salicampi TaxID=175306 RepID=A0A4Y9ADV9_9BACI|nr:hypothetical protein E4U82_06505 [Lentibacillus salicampi]